MIASDNNYRIVSYGDSTTATRLPDVEKVYSDLLREALPSKGVDGEVTNKGVGGRNTDVAASKFNEEVMDLDPNLVIIQFGINDALGPDFVALNTYTDHLTGMIRDLHAAGSKVILMTPNRLTSQDNLLVPYVESVRNIADTEGVALVDVYKMFTDYATDPSHSVDDLLLDGQHPNQLGHQMVADALEALIPVELGVVPEPSAAMILMLNCGALAMSRRPARH